MCLRPVVIHFQNFENLIFFINFASCAVTSCWQKQLEQALQYYPAPSLAGVKWGSSTEFKEWQCPKSQQLEAVVTKEKKIVFREMPQIFP